MNWFTIQDVIEFKRKNLKNLYLIKANGKQIHDWPLISAPHLTNKFCVKINTPNIIVHKRNDKISLELKDPVLLSGLPKLSEENEYPVIISEGLVSDVIVEILLEDEMFSTLIEINRDKVSKNSKKVMTATSLRKLISNIFSEVNFDEVDDMVIDLKDYIENLFTLNPELLPSTVNDKQKISEYSVKNTINAWYVYLKYFWDQWRDGSDYILVPDTKDNIVLRNWSGEFFNRSNPILKEIYSGSSRPHYPSISNQNKIYKEWIKFQNPS